MSSTFKYLISNICVTRRTTGESGAEYFVTDYQQIIKLSNAAFEFFGRLRLITL